jgi:hypothetical protein
MYTKTLADKQPELFPSGAVCIIPQWRYVELLQNDQRLVEYANNAFGSLKEDQVHILTSGMHLYSLGNTLNRIAYLLFPLAPKETWELSAKTEKELWEIRALATKTAELITQILPKLLESSGNLSKEPLLDSLVNPLFFNTIEKAGIILNTKTVHYWLKQLLPNSEPK